MASLFAPAPVGASISGFTDAFQRAQVLRQQQERGAQLAQLAQLQIAREEEAAREATLARSVVPHILGAPSQPVEMVPAQPPSVAMMGEPGTPDELGVPVPGRPSIAEHALTPGMLAGRPEIGPAGLAAAIARPEGRAALALKGVVSEADLEVRKRKRQAFETYRDSTDEAHRAYAAGDPERGLLAEAKAYRALAPFTDNPVAAFGRADDLVQHYFKVHRDAQEREKAGRDLQRIHTALRHYQEASGFDTHGALMTALTTAESDAGRKRAMDLIGQIAAGKLDEVKFLPFQVVERRAAEILDEQDRRGGTIDRPTALRQALRENPQARARIVAAMVTDKGTLPDDYQQALYGATFPKNVYEEAKLAAQTEARRRRLIEGSAQHAEFLGDFVSRFVTAHTKERQREPAEGRDRELQELNATLTALVASERNLVSELRDAMPGDPERKGIERELADVRRQARGIRRRLEARGIGAPGAGATGPSAEDTKAMLEEVLADRHPGKRLRDLAPAQQQRVADEVSRRLEAGR